MIARTPPGALRRRFGFVAVVALSACGLLLAGGAEAVPIAAPGTSASSPPSVDITYKNRNPPRYPIEAVHKGEQGIVILDVMVDDAGNVAGFRVDQHGTNAAPILQLAAIQTANEWKFNPGHKDGKPVGGVIQIPVNFSLNNDPTSTGVPKPCPAGDLFDTASSSCIPAPHHLVPPAPAH